MNLELLHLGCHINRYLDDPFAPHLGPEPVTGDSRFRFLRQNLASQAMIISFCNSWQASQLRGEMGIQLQVSGPSDVHPGKGWRSE